MSDENDSASARRSDAPAKRASSFSASAWTSGSSGTKRSLGAWLVAATLFVAVLFPAGEALAFSDVPSSYWDRAAIEFVASRHTWMRDYGKTYFKPKVTESRRLLARALVRAFAGGARTDPRIKFKDLPRSNRFYRFANIAVKKGWMLKYRSGAFGPKDPIKVSSFDRALVLARGLGAAARGLKHIHTVRGQRYRVSGRFPYLQLAKTLQLHYNHTDEDRELLPSTYIPRDEVAYSLWRAKTTPSWLVDSTRRFINITLPGLDRRDRIDRWKWKLTRFGLAYVGFPYIWAGEWRKESPPGYCCGYQPKGGFDCSGFVWWVMKRYENGYNAAAVRSYAGWSLPERSSSTMAQYTPRRISFGNLRVGDLMFHSSSGGSTWQSVNHVGIYAGNNWMIHSGSGNGGVALEWVGEGWYRDHFVWGRRLIGAPAALAHPIRENFKTAGG